MFEIGTSLRQARQHRGLEVADVERATRIRARYLTALEEERFDALPGVAYVRGFLRTYAEFLGLDSNLLIEEYNVRFAPPEDDLPPIQPVTLQRPAPRFARPVAGVAAAAVVFGGLAVWQLGFASSERTPIPQAHAAAPRVHRVAAHPKAVTPKATAKAKPSVVPRGPATLVLRATRGKCWVLVRVGSPSGRVVYERIVGEGSTLRFGLGKKLWVRLGAPWNLDVTLRGKQLPPFPRRIVNLSAA